MDVTVLDTRQPLPDRLDNGALSFGDYPQFRPNRTPKQVIQIVLQVSLPRKVLQAGSFGGTYFRTIKSGVTGLEYKEAWKEFPSDWFESKIETLLTLV